MFTSKQDPAPLSKSQFLTDYFAEHNHKRGMLDITDDRELGRLLWACAQVCETGHDEVLTELRLRHYVMSPSDAEVGMKVRARLPLAPLDGVVCEVTNYEVTVEFSTEQTVDAVGSQYTTYDAALLLDGALVTPENLVEE